MRMCALSGNALHFAERVREEDRERKREGLCVKESVGVHVHACVCVGG